MLDRMRQYLGVSELDAQKRAQVTVWLNAILFALLATATVVAVLFIVLGEGEGLLLTVAADIFFASLLLLVRRGCVRIASVLLVLLLLVAATLAAYTAGGVNAGAITAYFLILALSALLLSENAMLVVALLSVLALWGLFYAGLSGAIFVDNLQSSFVKLVIQSLMLGTTALVLRFAMRWLSGALELARSSEQALTQSNRELQREIAERDRIEANRAQVEEALRQHMAQLEARNEELDAFAHMVAHDLSGPLAHMVGFAEALQEDLTGLSDEEVCRHLQTISRSGRKMSGIIKELLLLASVRQVADITLVPLDMAGIVAEARHRLADLIEERQAEVILPAENAWPVALGYPPWVEEVWYNYLSNALNHGGQPPRVELGAEVQRDDVTSPMVRFWICDEGPGLTPEQQARLFRPFTQIESYTQRAKGYGLGLSIVRRIVEKLRGRVGVESEVGHGSLFWFTLPKYGSSPADQAEAMNEG
jgi:signal transduction histidine kinase